MNSENQHRHDEIADYFESYDTPLTDKFDFDKCVEESGYSVEATHVFLCNLEDEDVMKEIAEGNYDNFDIGDRSIFNDSYGDIISSVFQG